MFDKVCGTDKVRLEFVKNFDAAPIQKMWTKDIPAYKAKASKYFLYK
jgi:hypothetical protein